MSLPASKQSSLLGARRPELNK